MITQVRCAHAKSEVHVEVHLLSWIVLSLIIAALITIDIVGHVRTPHAPSLKEAAWWSLAYILLALAFGVFIWLVYGGVYASEYIAGWATEKALSIDNLFVFVIIMASFRVPREFQQKALLSGIIIALFLRLIFILVGAAVIARFSWIFYIFGLWLLYTAYTQVKAGTESVADQEEEVEYRDSRMTAFVRRFVPVTDGFMGQRFLYRHGGKTLITPLLLVVIALGSADIMFAFDSIPAIFGLTQEPYLVFAANAFALLGLRQLYFLIDGLLQRLIYLHWGLAFILAFIGVKLILHAMHENSVPFINGGQPFHVPEIGIVPSLGVIITTITVTVIASLIGVRVQEKKAAALASTFAATADGEDTADASGGAPSDKPREIDDSHLSSEESEGFLPETRSTPLPSTHSTRPMHKRDHA